VPQIFEIFGYPIDDRSEEAEQNRRAARCPFMGRDCDGGGNRYLSQIDLSRNPALRAMFPERSKLSAGVCSIQVKADTAPWIVCPRRLLVLGRERAGERTHQRNSEIETLRLLGYPSGTRLGLWPEVKLKYTSVVNDVQMSFDYTFDYLIVPIASVSQSEIESATNESWSKLQRIFQNGGYAIAKRGNEFYIEDCPTGVPSIIEIMTSSTSGGNKDARTTIPMAFEDAMLGRPHNGPGINYRQVWARMVSQLIVKSEIALSWGGKTIWVVQDLLVDYICASTALNIRQFLSENTSEVNMLSFSYGEAFEISTGVIDLSNPQLFAGPMTSTPGDYPQARPSFQDIIRAPICPPLHRVLVALARRKPINQVIAP
jgi:hypothetical protein